MKDYTVAAHALRTASKTLNDTAAAWVAAGSELNGAKLGTDDLGYLGRVANIPAKYNTAVDAVWQKIDQGQSILALSAVQLRMTANNYDHADDATLKLMPKIGR
jgi:hypothetical protein